MAKRYAIGRDVPAEERLDGQPRPKALEASPSSCPSPRAPCNHRSCGRPRLLTIRGGSGISGVDDAEAVEREPGLVAGDAGAMLDHHVGVASGRHDRDTLRT